MSRTQNNLLIGLYALTGLTSLAYEVLWARMLSLQFGVSVIGVVITVTAFMAGLGAGSLAAAHWAKSIKNPLRILALLEGGIACYALMLPGMLHVVADEIEAIATHVSLLQWYVLVGSDALFLLMIPAAAMGAGFILILKAVGSGTANLASIYGANTLGAACGALLPLLLLPVIGWRGAMMVIALIGLMLSLCMLWLAMGRGTEVVTEEEEKRPSLKALVGYAAIGAASLMLEIAWTRIFGMVMLRTEYVLAIILVTFLVGIGIGSLLATRARQPVWFVAMPLMGGGFAILSLWVFPLLSAWVERSTFASLFSAIAVQGFALLLVTLPVTLVLGAWLPLLNSRFEGGGKWLYGANCLGSACGASIAGLVLIPVVGSAGTIVFAALLILVIGLFWAEAKLTWLAVPLAIMLAWPVAKLPEVGKLLPMAQAGSHDLFRYEDAVSITQVVEQPDGQRVLLTDLQRMDASTEPTAVMVQENQARLPLLLQGAPHSVLFLGLGTGISVAGSLSYPELRRSAVELSQGAIDAARTIFEPANGGVIRQTDVVRDDARHFLSATPQRYDVIIGDVFHPDLAGMSALLSLQQFQRARARLTDDGVFVQWLAINQFDADSMKTVLRTFRQVFPDAQMFIDGMHLALVGPHGKFQGAAAVRKLLGMLSPAQTAEATAGEGAWTWLGRYCGPVPVSVGRFQDEWSPVIEFSLPRARYSGRLDVISSLQLILQGRPTMQDAKELLGISVEEREPFERAYAATEFMGRSWLAAMQGDMGEAGRMMRMAYAANPKDRWVQYALADNMYASLGQARAMGLDEKKALQKILSLNPRHVESLRALWHIQSGEHEKMAAEATRRRLLEISPFDREARAGGEIAVP